MCLGSNAARREGGVDPTGGGGGMVAHRRVTARTWDPCCIFAITADICGATQSTAQPTTRGFPARACTPVVDDSEVIIRKRSTPAHTIHNKEIYHL